MNDQLSNTSPEPQSSEATNAAKRTASDAGLDGSEVKTTRKRAAKACQSCRSRKVRCSVSEHGVPCYNCKLDELECIVPERKRPTRTAKRERSIGAMISEAIAQMDNSSSENAESPSDTAHWCEAQKHSDWGDSTHGPYDMDASPTSPTSSSKDRFNLAEEPLSQENSTSELPPCDSELARWFSVMPPRVVDKMFEYLTALHRCGQPGSSASKIRAAWPGPRSRVRLAPPESRIRSSRDTSRRFDRRYMSSSWPSMDTQMPQLSPPESPVEELSHSLLQQSRKGTSLLEKLCDDYANAADLIQSLEGTIRKADAHGAGQANSSVNAGLPNLDYAENISLKKTPVLTPPPDNDTMPSAGIHALQQLETLFATSQKGSESRRTVQEGDKQDAQNSPTTSGPRGDEEQNQFDSLFNLGPEGDALFQSLGYDI